MKTRMILTSIFFLTVAQLSAQESIHLDSKNNLFVPPKVPACGLVSSNVNRIERIKNHLQDVTSHEIPWGGAVHIGKYKGKEVFLASAPVGTGSGLVFTELYAAGAQYIIRYGTDDTPNPGKNDETLIKIVDEADNLIGYEQASGIEPHNWGKSINASPVLILALQTQARKKGLKTSLNICHHLENYHAFRTPAIFPAERAKKLYEIKNNLQCSDKGESWDMETAVLFRVAKDYNRHAATVLQTVDKRSPGKLGPYEGKNRAKAQQIENTIFIDYVLTTLTEIDENK